MNDEPRHFTTQLAVIGSGIAGFAVPGDNNVEIFRRLAHWAAGMDAG